MYFLSKMGGIKIDHSDLVEASVMAAEGEWVEVAKLLLAKAVKIVEGKIQIGSIDTMTSTSAGAGAGAGMGGEGGVGSKAKARASSRC